MMTISKDKVKIVAKPQHHAFKSSDKGVLKYTLLKNLPTYKGRIRNTISAPNTINKRFIIRMLFVGHYFKPVF